MKRLWLILVLLVSFRISMAESEKFDETVILLNSGYEMPQYGISCAGHTAEKADMLVYTAIQKGFRLIAAGGSSESETGAGLGIRRAIEDKLVNREDIFISVPFHVEKDEDSGEAIHGILERLGLDYIDLMTLEQNDYAIDLEGWKAMEDAAADGLIRSIGLSGYSDIRNYDLFINNAVTLPPAVLQIPLHPYEQRQDMRDHLAEAGTVLVSSSPLGGEGESQVLFADPVISTDATWHKKTSPQIILRWQLQSGNIVMPSVSDEAQIDEFFDIFDFELSDEEMTEINNLDRSLNLLFY